MNSPSRILITFALEREASLLRPALQDIPHAEILVTGMGASRSTSALDAYFRRHIPCAVITCGYAGALTPELGYGALVYETRSTSLASALESSGARRATILCAPRVAVTIEEKRQLFQSTQASAVEMESGAIQAFCAERDTPCATLRAISDLAGENLPLDFNQLTGPDQQLSAMKLALAIARRPWRIPRLMALGRHSHAASVALAQCLTAALRVQALGSKA